MLHFFFFSLSQKKCFAIITVIGAGGNASNQSAMLVVRGLATGEVTRHNFVRLIVRELSLALFIGSTMMAVAYTRVYLFHSADGNSAALAV